MREYDFYADENYDILRTSDEKPHEISGNQVIVREYPDRIVTDHCHIIGLIKTEMLNGRWNHFYAIDRHYREVDHTPENKKLTGKLDAAIQSNAMLEDCLVEMAGIVYA